MTDKYAPTPQSRKFAQLLRHLSEIDSRNRTEEDIERSSSETVALLDEWNESDFKYATQMLNQLIGTLELTRVCKVLEGMK